jgi:1A family penicillin-binding protein
MSASNGRKPTLTAERRYATGKSGAGKGGGTGDGGTGKGRKPAKPATSRRRAARPAKRTAPRGPVGYLAALVSGLIRFVVRVIWGVGWRMAFALALVVGLGVAYYAAQLPPVADLVDGRARGSVTLLDRDGATFAWRGDQFGGMVTADTISPYLRNAVVATEDRRFWWHPGVDPQGVASAVRINLSEGRGPLSGNGGSTITQQTAKLLCLGKPFDASAWKNESEYEADCRRTTLWRKVQEAVYAMAMEARYTKDEILTIYINRAYLGAGTRGFEAASQRYFGKPAAQVNPAEAAMLAGLLKAPTTYAPTNNLGRSQDRASVIVGLMREQGYLSDAEAEAARTSPAVLSPTAQQDQGGYFADWVMDTGPEFFTRDTTEDVVIRTTLDPRIQTATEKALLQVFEERVAPGSEAQAAIVVMSADGAVRAMVGGRNVSASGAFNRATQALRQTGSSFKPFIYAAALDLGMQPFDFVDDSPLTMNIPGSGAWSPENYDRKYDGMVTLTEALAESRNIPAVKVSEQVGRENVRTVAAMFGIDSDLAAGPALALGVSESTLLEMTGAYAGILNGGSSVTPYGLVELKLKGDDTPLMGTGGGIGERVISQDAAEKLTWMMSRVVAEGTGSRAQIDGWEVAGKTGTTQGARDAWFVGFAGDYVAGVWMGYDDNRPLSGVTGGGLPATIWREAMVRVLEGQPVKPLPMRVPEQIQPQAIAGADSQDISPSGGQASDPETDRLLREMLGAPQPAQSAEAPAPAPAPAPDQAPAGNDRERLILDVLTNILGGVTN